MEIFLILATLSFALSEDLPLTNHAKRSYICPPQFIRQGHRCYYFSKEPMTWQDSMFNCRKMRSNLAVIKQANQDKLIRNFLSKKSIAPLERWLGAIYDWKSMDWKWTSGKTLTYNGFDKMNNADRHLLQWHCVVMDPSAQFRWNPRPCMEKKHFICQTKLKVASAKAKKKLARQYHANNFNKLNEIPVPRIPEYHNLTSLKGETPVNYKLKNQGLSGYLPKGKTRKVKKHSKKSNRRNWHESENGFNHTQTARRRKTTKETDKLSLDKLQWVTYNKNTSINDPLYPKPIVMEFSFNKK